VKKDYYMREDAIEWDTGERGGERGFGLCSRESRTVYIVLCSEFLAIGPEVPGSIAGPSRVS
jgi:hypothetical protein